MELWVARHGEVDWNAVGKLCGRTDLPLNAKGLAQAHTLAEMLAGEGLPFDCVIASPLKRARQTAAIVAERLGTRLETDDRLVEQDFGIFEGQSNRDADFLHARANFAIHCQGGESALQVAQRLYNFLDALRTRMELRRVLLVSHGSAVRIMRTYFCDMDQETFLQWHMENGEVLRFQL